MTEPQTNPSSELLTPPPVPTGVFGTKIPSAVAFAVGVLLFLLPFAEIKCSGTKFADKTGLAMATNGSWHASAPSMSKDLSKDRGDEKEGNSQIYALISLLLAAVALGLSFAPGKQLALAVGLAGALSAVSLVLALIDLQRWFDNSVAKDMAKKSGGGGDDSFGFDKLGDMGSMIIKLSFTPWAYVAVAALLAGSVFGFLKWNKSK